MVRIHCNDRTLRYCCGHLHEYSAYKRLGPNFHSVVYTVAWQYPIMLFIIAFTSCKATIFSHLLELKENAFHYQSSKIQLKFFYC